MNTVNQWWIFSTISESCFYSSKGKYVILNICGYENDLASTPWLDDTPSLECDLNLDVRELLLLRLNPQP